MKIKSGVTAQELWDTLAGVWCSANNVKSNLPHLFEPDEPKPEPVYQDGVLWVATEFRLPKVGERFNLEFLGLLTATASDTIVWIMEPTALPPKCTNPKYRHVIGKDGHPVLLRRIDDAVFWVDGKDPQKVHDGSYLSPGDAYHGFRWLVEEVPSGLEEVKRALAELTERVNKIAEGK